ncbi:MULTISPECIES: Rab family GTPase [unclassified Coleofasciculus]|uniref:Rab family GTPase n=1 Tax=unclassified Coleofasciculus TaxID=2692782 RepID=UPI001882C658|nr:MULTISPECIES: Rab family GTPase [unclassified Coleofasciculus]MBE9126458.1 GTP-binding protein [Coleofasciculus sp. LEGE 07081]MBE9148896.1 GTP-binding protein [Coleofasciculus sp. LEGE 07092]
MTQILSKKVCMLGDFSVGKTSLIRRFVERQFSDNYLSTVGVKISKKTVQVQSLAKENAVSIQMLIWDLEGNTKFKAVTPTYLRGASSAVIVADVSRQVTVDHILDHVQSFLSVNPQGFASVAFNKADLLTEEQLRDIFKRLSLDEQRRIIATYPTSAKTGTNVDKLFYKLACKMIESTSLTSPKRETPP